MLCVFIFLLLYIYGPVCLKYTGMMMIMMTKDEYEEILQ